MRQFIRVVKTPLTLLALTALVAFGGFWGYKNATAEIPPRPAEPCVMTDVGGVLTPKYVTVRTLNAGLNGGLAKRASTTLRSRGFFILKVNNSDQRMAQTVVVGNSKDDPNSGTPSLSRTPAIPRRLRRPLRATGKALKNNRVAAVVYHVVKK